MQEANKGQSSQALIIQSYANSVDQQPKVDFSGEPSLKKYEKSINDGLQTAQSHANQYLNVIQPVILENVSNIWNYYALHNAIATTLPEGSTEQQWIAALNVLVTESWKVPNSRSQCCVTATNSKQELECRFCELQNCRGVFIICVGAIAGFVTGGAYTPVVVGDVALLTAGIAGEVAAAITLKNLNDEKANLLTEKTDLRAEVKLATGISVGYKSLNNQVKGAVTAAFGMSSAWNSLSDDLNSMIDDLRNGIKSAGEIRTIFLTVADTVIKTVLSDINIIKKQMVDVTNIVAKIGQTVGEAAVGAAHGKKPVSDVLVTKSGAPSGNLSQSLENLHSAETQISEITYLPRSAVIIQIER